MCIQNELYLKYRHNTCFYSRNCNLIKAMLSTIIRINILRTSVIAYIVLTDCIMCYILYFTDVLSVSIVVFVIFSDNFVVVVFVIDIIIN